MKKTLQSLVNQLKTLQSARFASITYTAKGTGETARHRLLLGASIEASYKADLSTLKRKRKTLTGIPLQACEELIESLKESLSVGIGNNSGYTCKDVYEPISKGLKIHKENGELHVYGFTLGKTVIREGKHKIVNSSEKTIAKNELRKTLKSGKFRQFVLSSDNVKRFCHNKKAFAIA